MGGGFRNRSHKAAIFRAEKCLLLGPIYLKINELARFNPGNRTFDKENKHKRIHANVGTLARGGILVENSKRHLCFCGLALDMGVGSSVIKSDISRPNPEMTALFHKR